MQERRIAAYGGTFDPVHNGHIEIARAVLRNFAVDELLMILAHRPPHKTTRPIAYAYHRFAMAALATLDEPRMLVSTIELESPERPYTFETIERLRDDLGSNTRLYFVIGADSFEEINTWREPNRLLASTNLIVITRPGHDIDVSHLDEGFQANVVDLRRGKNEPMTDEASNVHRIYLTDYVNTSISSTGIRQRVREGQSVAAMVPAQVAEYIQKYELYRQ
jgi:nicotinate-nucleotide adenylyltransferase